MELRFRDHASFHRAAAGAVIGSAILGLALHAVTPMAAIVGGMFGLAVGAAWGYRKIAWRIGIAIAAVIVLRVLPPSWPALALVATMLSIGLVAQRGFRGVLAVMFGAVVTLLAMWTAIKIGHAQQTATWSGWAITTAAAAAMGMVGVLAMLPRHVVIASDPVIAAIRRLPKLDSETRGLCDRATAIWATAKTLPDPSAKQLVCDGVLKTLEVAMKSAEACVAEDPELAKRIADLDHRITAATDAETRAQYQAARGALDDQRRYREQIRANRERSIARMHNHVAALEKFQLAATGLARVATNDATKQLEELSHEVAASSEALAEVSA